MAERDRRSWWVRISDQGRLYVSDAPDAEQARREAIEEIQRRQAAGERIAGLQAPDRWTVEEVTSPPVRRRYPCPTCRCELVLCRLCGCRGHYADQHDDPWLCLRVYGVRWLGIVWWGGPVCWAATARLWLRWKLGMQVMPPIADEADGQTGG